MMVRDLIEGTVEVRRRAESSSDCGAAETSAELGESKRAISYVFFPGHRVRIPPDHERRLGPASGPFEVAADRHACPLKNPELDGSDRLIDSWRAAHQAMACVHSNWGE